MNRNGLYASGPIVRTIVTGAYWMYVEVACEVWNYEIRPRLSVLLIRAGTRIQHR